MNTQQPSKPSLSESLTDALLSTYRARGPLPINPAVSELAVFTVMALDGIARSCGLPLQDVYGRFARVANRLNGCMEAIRAIDKQMEQEQIEQEQPASHD